MRKKREPQTDAEYVRGGKGRRDEVGRSGVYPASDVNAPAGAEVRGQGDFGHTSPRGQALQTRTGDHNEGVPEFENPESEEQSDRSPNEHDRGVRNSEIRRETQTSAAMGTLPGKGNESGSA